VTYVGNANNYKAMLEEQESANDALTSNNASLKRQMSTKAEEWKQNELELKQRNQELEQQLLESGTKLRQAEKASTEYVNKVDSWAGLLKSFDQTIKNLETSLSLTQAQLDKAREDGIRDQQELNQITASLIEKIAQMQALEQDRRRFLEEKKTLEAKLNQLFASETTTEGPAVVTPQPGMVKPVQPVSNGAPLNGLIAEVGESLVTISIGADDGVSRGMVFHVTRGDEFICDVVITNVDTNKAAGVLELKLKQPRIGDNVSTKL
jgi:hypothetical protein